jgi:hypothetical protein
VNNKVINNYLANNNMITDNNNDISCRRTYNADLVVNTYYSVQ